VIAHLTLKIRALTLETRALILEIRALILEIRALNQKANRELERQVLANEVAKGTAAVSPWYVRGYAGS
jgi:hypothetical protein